MKKPIHLIIDTSVLWAKSLDNIKYEVLQRLVEKNIVIFYLHHIVKEEYRTQLESKYLESLNNIKKNLKMLTKYNDNKIKDMLHNIDTLKHNIDKQVNDYMKENFDNKLQARYIDIQPNDANVVFERYFAGLPPFIDRSNRRKNIPDAFIFISLLKMVNENKNIIFITNDKNFIESIKDINENNNNKIEIFDSIEAFIEAKEIKISASKDSQAIMREVEKIPRTKVLPEKITKFIEIIQSNHIIKYIFSDDWNNPFNPFEKIKGLSKISNGHIPSIDNTATITYIVEIYENTIQADFEKITYYSNDTIGIPITFRVEVESQLIVSRNIINDIMSQWGGIVAETRDEHYCDVEKNIELEINATLIIVVSNNTNDINSMNIDMEINNAKFIDFAY